MGGVYMDFSKASYRLLWKVRSHGIQEELARWLSIRSQDGSEGSLFRLKVTCGALQGLVLDPFVCCFCE